MAIDSISSATLGQNQFLQLLSAQLQNQDPLNPVTDTDFIAQIAQFSTLDSLQTLNASFAQMLRLEQLTQGAGLIGKNVTFTGADNPNATGKVDSVSVQDGQIVLTIGGEQVPLDKVQTVTA